MIRQRLILIAYSALPACREKLSTGEENKANIFEIIEVKLQPSISVTLGHRRSYLAANYGAGGGT